jgi:hypothetical protein
MQDRLARSDETRVGRAEFPNTLASPFEAAASYLDGMLRDQCDSTLSQKNHRTVSSIAVAARR